MTYTPPIWLLLIGAIVVALAIFLIRHKWPRICGVFEICVGFLLIYLAESKTQGAFSSGWSAGYDVTRTVILWSTVIGAVFVMVDGLNRLRTSRSRTGPS